MIAASMINRFISMPQAAIQQENTSHSNFFGSANLHRWQLPQFAFVPQKIEPLRTSLKTGEERFVYSAHGDINVDADGKLVISVQSLSVRGDFARKELMRSLLADEVELDARLDLGQVIDCLIDTTSLSNGKPDPEFEDLHIRVSNHLRELLQKLERFTS